MQSQEMARQLYLTGMRLYHDNVSQAYLCLEQSRFLCEDEEDRQDLSKLMEELRARPGFRVRPVSAVVVSYNEKALMQRCLQAFRDTVPEGAWEFIAVDNASTDGVDRWLADQPDVKLIRNEENLGFSVGCNRGYALADPCNDLLLINNDAVLTPHALFFLRMALYSSRDVGAVGPVSNNASGQEADPVRLPPAATLPECLAFAEENNWFTACPYEARARLTGFAVLLSRDCCGEVTKDGFLMDPLYSPAYFEDDDLGMRIALAGFRQLLVHNALVYHKGGTGFRTDGGIGAGSRERFRGKWGFDSWNYLGVLEDHEEAVDALLRKRSAAQGTGQGAYSLRILELDCGMGVNLAHLKYLYPNSTVLGIEGDPVIAAIAARLVRVLPGTPDQVLEEAQHPGTPEALALVPGAFDIIFVWDALTRSGKPEELRLMLARLLKEDGEMILYNDCDKTGGEE